MKRQASVLVNVPNDPNPRRKQKPKLRRQDAFGIHKPLGTIKPELKYNDLGIFTAVPPFGGYTSFLLNGLQTGGSPSQRVGRKVNWTKLNVRYSFHIDQGSSPTSGCAIRMVYVFDKQANGTAPTATSIFLVDEFNSPLQLDNRDRFVILADVITDPISLGGSYATAGTFNRKFNLETIYNGNGAGTIADIATGSIYVFYAQSNGAGIGGSNVVSANIRNRLRFLDF